MGVELKSSSFMSTKTYLFSTSSHPDAISINSLDITLFKPKYDFSQYDYFILSSKQASNALKQYSVNVLKPALCISKVTANSYEEIAGEVLEIANGYGDDLSLLVKKYPKSTKWLYLRAKIVATGFVSQCQEEGYDIDELIIYESTCSKEILNIDVGEKDILIFTSPSSIDCFLKNAYISTLNRVIVIGKTTALRLPKNIRYQIAKEKTIESCIKLI